MALVVQHDNERVEPLPVKHGIGAERTRGSNAFCRGRLDCRLDESDLLPAEQTVFAGVRVKAADRYFWGGNAAALERPICGLNDVQDFSRVIRVIASLTLWCKVQWTIRVSLKQSMR